MTVNRGVEMALVRGGERRGIEEEVCRERKRGAKNEEGIRSLCLAR